MDTKSKKDSKKIHKTSFIKKKAGPQLGYRTPDHFKASKFSSGRKNAPSAKFNPAQFKTQHKG